MSQVYPEGRVAAYVNSTLVSDPDTKEALRCSVEREGKGKNKSSTLMQCHTILGEVVREEDNLQKWGFRVDHKCAIEGCGKPCTSVSIPQDC